MKKNLKNLNIEELHQIFETMPVDITFVDSDDRVKYFSKLGKRIFPRGPATIGRPVQMCHPSESVDKVNRILSDFREGKRDNARFWINYKDMFVVINYYALRDEDGKYMGCLEVSQDATEIRKLKGEKRLSEE